MTVRPIRASADDFVDEPFYSKLRTRTGFPLRDDLMVFADCNCGWAGPIRWCVGEILADEIGRSVRADRAGHEAATGHGEDPTVGTEGRHEPGCGFYHRLGDRCPLPASSPSGMVHRVLRGTINDRHAAIDRLTAIEELGAWLTEEEQKAVIGARLARATWTEMGRAVGITRQGAFNRWGATIKAYEAAGLLSPAPDAPAAVPPVDPSAGTPGNARSWCRWCGNRVVVVDLGSGGRWGHLAAEGLADTPSQIDVPDCPGPEPWPSHLPWYADPEQRADIVTIEHRQDPHRR